MKKLILIALTCLLLFPSLVHAGWNNTEWGMTPKEVASILKLRLPFRSELSPDGERHYKMGKYLAFGHEFELIISFMDNGLYAVYLSKEAPEAPAIYEEIIQLFNSRYGEPIRINPSSHGLIRWLYDETTHISLRLRQPDYGSYPSCSLFFYPKDRFSTQ